MRLLPSPSPAVPPPFGTKNGRRLQEEGDSVAETTSSSEDTTTFYDFDTGVPRFDGSLSQVEALQVGPQASTLVLRTPTHWVWGQHVGQQQMGMRVPPRIL